MTTYRHRTMGRIAEKHDHLNSGDYTIDALDANYSKWSIAYPDLRVVRTIPLELIENSQDRELVEEKDWIDEAYEYYMSLDKKHNVWETGFREAIEKHMHKCSCNCK